MTTPMTIYPPLEVDRVLLGGEFESVAKFDLQSLAWPWGGGAVFV